ncbi:MAG: bifunctional adenosylcobinamide kinase/adenosylcobinamide-phosphate guanylyltransferase [Hyphomicrobiales bacterium]|nr:MAG: bifunctional adenosylcobinamide kinase/adenosylcobinamide-phosphate guanylyltransferase [Hyphomicrobiales bacterium]
MTIGGHGGLTLVLGGARSGKSQFAGKLAVETGRKKIYLATGQALDDEMIARVAKHQKDRGADWVLVEEPLDLIGALKNHAENDNVILIDCLTLWLTNLMMDKRDVPQSCNDLAVVLSAIPTANRVILVSNEVGQGIVPIEKMSREFRDHAGWLHQKLAQVCGHVWFVTAGLPQKLK